MEPPGAVPPVNSPVDRDCQGIPAEIRFRFATQKCDLLSIDRGVAFVRTPFRMIAGDRIHLAVREAWVLAEVTSCQEHGKNFIIQFQIVDQSSSRRETRIPVHLKGTLTLVNQPDTEQSVTVVDISPSGMGIRLEHSLPVHAKVAVYLSSGVYFGEVRHCRPAEKGGYFGGLLVTEGFPKTAPEPKPQVQSVRQWLYRKLQQWLKPPDTAE